MPQKLALLSLVLAVAVRPNTQEEQLVHGKMDYDAPIAVDAIMHMPKARQEKDALELFSLEQLFQ